MARLLDVLREELGLTGTKEGCGEGECGTCAVLIDGKLANSCLVPILQVQGAEIRTIEGLANSGPLHRVQEAFLASGAVQCGFCTPGMILAAVSLLDREPKPKVDLVRSELAGMLCRCTGYTKILAAIVDVLQQEGGDG
jgi:carbon-monoxide dehydrogenase small subunit